MHVACFEEPPAAWADRVAEIAEDAAGEPGEPTPLGLAPVWSRVFRAAYGLPSLVLVARRSGERWRGALTLVRVRRLDGRRELVSMPFLDDGGVAAADEEAERALLDAARRHARRLGARDIELRQRRPLAAAPAAPPAPRVAMTLPLPDAEEALWRALPAKTRNQVRKAWRSDLVAERGGEPHVAGFYAVHRARMRELGSPVHSERFFRSVARAFGPDLRVVLARDRRDAGRVVGALLAIRHGRTVSVPWASTSRSHDARCPGNLIYWEALRLALEEGATRFEFGRSAPGGGTWRFKRGWGAEPRPLPWTRLDGAGVLAAARPPQETTWLALLSRMWRRLPPAVCDRVGPYVRPHIAS